MNKDEQNSTSWRSYEEVAQYLLDRVAAHFGLERVEGKQSVAAASGADWEIDAKGIKQGDGGLVLVECKRYTKHGVPQGVIAEMVFKIQDTGATGGIIVSPLPLQSGAKLVANSQNIQEVRLFPDSTTTEYVLRFLEQVFIGMSDKLNAQDTVSAKVR